MVLGLKKSGTETECIKKQIYCKVKIQDQPN